MWALCANDLLLLSLLLFIQFSCSICQTICLPMTPFLFPPLCLYCRSTRFEVRTGVNTVPTSCGVSSLREWGVQVAHKHFRSFSWSAQASIPPHPRLHALQERGVGVTSQNVPRSPVLPITAVSLPVIFFVPQSTDWYKHWVLNRNNMYVASTVQIFC